MAHGVSGEGSAPQRSPKDTAHIAVLSRVVETLRFTVGPALLATTVTRENLLDAFRSHEVLHTSPDTAKAARDRSATLTATPPVDEAPALKRQRRQQQSSIFGPPVESVEENLEEVWRIVGACHSGPLDVTYGDLFDFEFPAFPETTVEQRLSLAALLDSRGVITRAMVAAALGASGPDQTVDFLFASGAEAVPSVIFEGLVEGLGRHPRTHSFAPHFVEQRCLVGRRMLLMIPQLIALIVTVAIAPSVVNVEQRVIHENMMHWLNNDWTMGCSGGAAAHIAANATECNLLGMTFLDMNRPTQDALRFLREQLPLLLWLNDSAPAAETPLGGVFPIGVLTIRHVTENMDDARCAETGISTVTRHWELPATFGCGNDAVIQIPFSATRAEAAALVAPIILPPPGQTHDAVIVEFPAYSPTARMTVYSRMLVTLPRGGGVWPKLIISPIEHDAHHRVLPVLIVKLVGTVWAIIVAIRYRILSRTFGLLDVDFLLDIAMAAVAATSYGFLHSVSDVPGGLLDVTEPFSGVDEMADRFGIGMSLFGAYCFLVIGTFVRFARDIAGLQVLMDIMRSAALEIFGLGVLFIVWTMGFVFAAIILFGQTTPEYSSFLPAARSLLLYYVGINDLSLLSRHKPHLGPLFFVAFQTFVVFFAMNLLIAVLTAPLPLIKERTTLVYDTLLAARSRVGDGRGWWVRLKLEVGYFVLWPFVNTMLDALPWAHQHYTRCFSVLDTFYTSSDTTMDAAENIHKALDLLQLLSLDDSGATQGNSDEQSKQSNSGELWSSPLLETVLEQGIVGNNVALSIVLVVIAEESMWSVVRDARLLRMLVFYERFSSGMHRVLRLQEAFRPLAAERTRAVAAVVDGSVTDHQETDHAGDTSKVPSQQASEHEIHPTAQTSRCRAEEAPTFSAVGVTAPAVDDAPSFAFARELRRHMAQAKSFLFFAFLTVIALWIFLVPFFSTLEYTAFLADALDSGILDMPWRTRCYDADCAKAWSKNKTLLEVGDLGEYRTWLSDVLEEQLYRRDMDGLPFAGTNATYFDSRVLLSGPFTIRQIRGKHTPCGSFNGPPSASNRSFYAARQVFVDEFRCVLGAASGFATAEMPMPPGGYPPLIGKTAYVEQDVCAEDEPSKFYGRFAQTYPCRGYSATIGSREALREIIDSNWVDGDTRLVAVTADFTFGLDAVEYTTLTELSENGGAATSAGFAFPIVTSSKKEYMASTRIVFQAVLVLQLLFAGGSLLWYLYNRFCRGRSADEASDLLPAFPAMTVATSILVFVVFQFTLPPSSRQVQYNQAIEICAIVYFGYMLTAFVIFPMASLLSRKMTVLIATLHNTVAQLIYVVPYAAFAFLALTFMAYVTWGRYLHEYSRLLWAAREVVVMGFGGTVDVESLQAQRFVEAQIFTAVVFAVFIVVLSNLFLAMVTSASGDAQETPLATELAEGVIAVAGGRVVYGRFYNCGLAFMVSAIRTVLTLTENSFVAKIVPASWTLKRDPAPIICTYKGRLVFPAETLFASFSPLRCTATLRFFCHDALPAVAFSSLIPHLLEVRRDFERRQVHNAMEDRRMEIVEATHYAASLPTPSDSSPLDEQLVMEVAADVPAMALPHDLSVASRGNDRNGIVPEDLTPTHFPGPDSVFKDEAPPIHATFESSLVAEIDRNAATAGHFEDEGNVSPVETDYSHALVDQPSSPMLGVLIPGDAGGEGSRDGSPLAPNGATL